MKGGEQIGNNTNIIIVPRLSQSPLLYSYPMGGNRLRALGHILSTEARIYTVMCFRPGDNSSHSKGIKQSLLLVTSPSNIHQACLVMGQLTICKWSAVEMPARQCPVPIEQENDSSAHSSSTHTQQSSI